MNPSKSFFAGVKNPNEQAENETLVIAQNGPQIEENWSFDGSKIRGQAVYRYPVDGRERSLSKGPNIPSTVRAEWQNCTLIANKVMPFVGGLKLEVRNTYVLSPDGLELTILQETHNAVVEVERRLVFDRR